LSKIKRYRRQNYPNWKKSIKSINTGKSADIYNITIEHIINDGEQMIIILLQIVNTIFDHGSVPDILKVGLLTPIFKNKGNIAEVINYRGIIVLPVINKIIETIVKNRTSHKILAIQNPLKRGFTKGALHLNSALPVEETYRENEDNTNECQLVLLDAKSAFDVLIRSHLMRRVYHAGIRDKHWSLINSMHQKASSSVKWDNKISQ
jgi:hypothetical protein